MNSTVVALGIASTMLMIGMALRAKIGFLRKMLVPVSVIAGVMGFLVMNVVPGIEQLGVTEGIFSTIVDVLFTISFISIGLSGAEKKKKKKDDKSTGPIKGAVGMGLIWCILYALTAVVGVAVIFVFGKAVGMDAIYGMLIPFAFCQGPGQASTYGRIFEGEGYGYANAEMVALTFAVIGFLAAFVLGVPLAKYGMRKGLAKRTAKMSPSVEKGYFTKEEQRESMGKVTTHSGNIETLTVHFALIGVSYLIALVLAKVVSFVPLFGSTFSGMLFFWGMIAAYIVKAVMRKLKIPFLIHPTLQGRITGWTSDYLVVCAFMAVKVGVIGEWIVPILIECIIVAVLTLVVSFFFGSRLGSDHDFERVLGLYGTCTGTTPSGVALLRMVDPRLETSTGTELGMMNIAMMFSAPTMIFITLAGLRTISLPMAMVGLLGTVVLYVVLLKVFGVFRAPSFTFKEGKREVEEGELGHLAILQGFLREEAADTVGLVK